MEVSITYSQTVYSHRNTYSHIQILGTYTDIYDYSLHRAEHDLLSCGDILLNIMWGYIVDILLFTENNKGVETAFYINNQS